MDFVNEDLVNLVHDGVCFFRAKPFREGSKALHVAEDHRDLLSFTLNLPPLGQDFLGESLWKVPLNLCQFLIQGRLFGGWLRGEAQVVATFATELLAHRDECGARRALDLHPGTAFFAEFHAFPIVGLTPGAFHFC